jgi:preprotein translocase subunit YajC
LEASDDPDTGSTVVNTLPAVVLLQAEPGGFDPSFFIMMGSIFAIFYFLIMRPQQKRQKEQEDKLKAAEKGDQVITAGGLHGKIVGASEDVLTLEIATLKGGEKLRVRVERSRLESVSKPKGGEDS